jgi:hypothetical protein
MAIADWLFKRLGRGKDRVDVDLPPLKAWFTGLVPGLEGKEVEPALVLARLADRYRDAGVEPMLPVDFDGLVTKLDAEGWRRLALAGSALDLEKVRRALPRLLAVTGETVHGQVQNGLVGLAEATPLLTMELLRQSPLRVEEFARHFLARLGAAVTGENVGQSRDRLERLDYARLLAEAERAKLSGEERLAYLRALQEEQEAGRPRRGKW